MNLIDFHVIEIISEERDKVWKLYGMSEKELDSSINDYIDGETAYNFDDRQHNSNDGCFELGFVPNPSSYIFPPGEITIGSKTGSALITVDGENISISGGNVQISGATVNIGEQTIIDGKVFLEHQHSNGNQGANTGGVV